ncbi:MULTISPECIES: SCO6880 family protein [unclassified Geodermatophilus]|uniref:SCO6880 family protein n=1 Tax=unclassified Geodermatophilus TaxID=2637632 RepID=UPI003EEC7EE4
MTAPSDSPRTYGNWRRPGSAGLGSLGALGTALLLLGLIGVIAALMLAGLLWAIAVAVVLGLLLTLLVVRDRHHRSGVQRLSTRLGWARARRSGANVYRSGPLGRVPTGTNQLPGLAAASELSEWQDSHGRPFAMVTVPATRHATVVLVTEPDGASLVDEEQIDTWVAHWGAWLSALGNEPGLVAASVTVETAPDSGTRLRREVDTHLDPRGPSVALEMLREVVDTYPAGSATVTAYVSLTFTAAGRAGGRKREPADVARDIGTRLPGLTAGLSATGAGVVRPATAQELCEVVRVAYDPSAARVLDEAHATGAAPELQWSDVGPTAAQAAWGHYRHDGALSVTWSMTEAPRGEVYSSVLADLIAPHPDIDRKRVTLLYRPLDAGRAARAVEQDRRTADFRASSSSRPTARTLQEQRAAALTAEEEARGAGLIDFGMLVTATVTDADLLDDPHAALDVVRAAVDSLSATARIQLRPVYGSQDSAFAAALPLGIVPSAHLNVPSELREAL